MISEFVALLAVLNPFALFLYLLPVMNDLSSKKFIYVLLRASLISFGVYAFFTITGFFIFESIFMIKFDSFRIFGGIIVLSIAYHYIIKGDQALIVMRENLDDLASEIALPFMVGAATVTLAIIIGDTNPKWIAVIGIGIVMALTFAIILIMKFFRDTIKHKHIKVAFDKNVGIILRLNAFIVGAIGVDMIVTGINALYF